MANSTGRCHWTPSGQRVRKARLVHKARLARLAQQELPDLKGPKEIRVQPERLAHKDRKGFQCPASRLRTPLPLDLPMALNHQTLVAHAQRLGDDRAGRLHHVERHARWRAAPVRATGHHRSMKIDKMPAFERYITGEGFEEAAPVSL